MSSCPKPSEIFSYPEIGKAHAEIAEITAKPAATSPPVNFEHKIPKAKSQEVNAKTNNIPSKKEFAPVLPAIVSSNFGDRVNFESASVPRDTNRTSIVNRDKQSSIRGFSDGFSDTQQDGDKLSVLSAGILEKSTTKESIATMVKILNSAKVDPMISMGEP
ncbi:hypothetical protein V2H45_10210 [Tumidithrix elongata RA019]|uniref:Uncharacterized protein n=1 Tax=Tumidithrix elongata BACA0141 TaxID=2716417 RepID=A0AAW9Q2Q7_9CYAN|nr:hypothetical protein [Tumidithrix elongata RA019]